MKTYRDWNTKFKNAIEQTRPQARKVLAFIESLTEAEIEAAYLPSKHGSKFDTITELYNDKYEQVYPGLDGQLEGLNRDLWAVLTAKSASKSDADDKIKGVAQGAQVV